MHYYNVWGEISLKSISVLYNYVVMLFSCVLSSVTRCLVLNNALVSLIDITL